MFKIKTKDKIISLSSDKELIDFVWQTMEAREETDKFVLSDVIDAVDYVNQVSDLEFLE